MIVKVVKREVFPPDIPEDELRHHVNQRVLEALRDRAMIEGREPYPKRETPQQPVDLIEIQLVFQRADI